MSRWVVLALLGACAAGCGSRSRLLDTGVSAAGAGGASAGGSGGQGGGAWGGSGGTSVGGAGGAGGLGGVGGGAGAPSCVYADVALGSSHTCALTANGTVWCFGANEFGQLGVGVPGSDSATPQPIAGPSDFVALGAGEYHTSGIRSDGSMMAWGHNPLGVLGTGTTSDSALPTPLPGPGSAVALSRGMVLSHACAVHGNGSVTCWGDNQKGNLGNGGFAPSPTQTQVIGLEDSVAVAVGYIFSCAVQWNGEVRCWGWNASAALGIGNMDAKSYPKPVPVPGVFDAVQVVAGNHYACARSSSGQVHCWGYNGHGQLGIGTNQEHALVPTPVQGLSDAVWLSGGQSHACAVRKGGTVSCWGRNYFGQLGVGTTLDSYAPVTVVGLTDATRVFAGGEHTCALSASQGFSCWGANESGQLGNGSSEKSLVPSSVLCAEPH